MRTTHVKSFGKDNSVTFESDGETRTPLTRTLHGTTYRCLPEIDALVNGRRVSACSGCAAKPGSSLCESLAGPVSCSKYSILFVEDEPESVAAYMALRLETA